MYRKVKQKQVKKFELNKERENIMKMLQKSAVMRGTDNMVIKEIPVPQIKDKEVLVSLEFVDQMYTTIITDAAEHTKWIFQKILC